MTQREFHQAMDSLESQLLGDVRSVIFNGTRADPEFPGDFLGGLVDGNHLEHAFLRRAQAFEARSFVPEGVSPLAALEKMPGERWTDEGTTGCDGLHCGHDFTGGAFL